MDIWIKKNVVGFGSKREHRYRYRIFEEKTAKHWGIVPKMVRNFARMGIWNFNKLGAEFDFTETDGNRISHFGRKL